MNRFYHISLFFITIAALGTLMDAKMRHMGDWLPSVPKQIGLWRGEDLPRDYSIDDSSRYIARLYVNPFGEGVQIFLMAPKSVDGYRDPRGCLRGSGYTVTAEKNVPLGDTRVRLMVLRYGDVRQIMAYWIQEKNGDTRPEAPAFAYSRTARAVETLKFAGQALLTPRPICLVRVFAQIPDWDPMGRQSRRNVLAIAQQVHEALRH